MGIQVRRLSEDSKTQSAWDAYVARHPKSTSDHRWGWRYVLTETFGYTPCFLGAFEGETLVGILPLFKVPRGFGRTALASIPFGNYGGLCADSMEAAKALVEGARALRDELQAEYVEFRHREALPDERLHAHTLYSRFSMPLQDVDTHWRELKRNERNKISRAKRLNMGVLLTRQAEAMYPIHLHTVRRLGTPCFPRKYFECILQEFKDAVVQMITYEGRSVAFTLLVPFKDQLLVQFNGSLSEYLHLKPNNFLFWNALEYACSLRLKELDYCRSRKGSGNVAFKRIMGLEETDLGYQYDFPNGHKASLRNPSSAKFQLAIRAWQRLPLGLTEFLGPKLVKYFA